MAEQTDQNNTERIVQFVRAWVQWHASFSKDEEGRWLSADDAAGLGTRAEANVRSWLSKSSGLESVLAGRTWERYLDALLHRYLRPEESHSGAGPISRALAGDEDVLDLIESAVSRREPLEQEIVHLRYRLGLKTDEIAYVLDRQRETIVDYGREAGAVVRRALNPQGGPFAPIHEVDASLAAAIWADCAERLARLDSTSPITDEEAERCALVCVWDVAGWCQTSLGAEALLFGPHADAYLDALAAYELDVCRQVVRDNDDGLLHPMADDGLTREDVIERHARKFPNPLDHQIVHLRYRLAMRTEDIATLLDESAERIEHDGQRINAQLIEWITRES